MNFTHNYIPYVEEGSEAFKQIQQKIKDLIKSCYDFDKPSLSQDVLTHFNDAKNAIEAKQIHLHKGGKCKDGGDQEILDYSSENFNTIVRGVFEDETPYDKCFVGSLEDEMPRMDQLPLTECVLDDKPDELTDMVDGSPFDQAFFLYIYSMPENADFITRMYRHYKDHHFKIQGSHKSNI